MSLFGRPPKCARCKEDLTIYEEDVCWECLADELGQQTIAAQITNLNPSLTPACKTERGPGDA